MKTNTSKSFGSWRCVAGRACAHVYYNRRISRRLPSGSIFLIIALLGALMCASPLQAGEFLPLVDLPGGAFESRTMGISNDGTAVIGASRATSNDYFTPFIWTRDDGMQPIDLSLSMSAPHADAASRGHPGPLDVSNYIYAINRHVVVGRHGVSGIAFRWDPVSGIEELDAYPDSDPLVATSATGVTEDGSIIVGIGKSDPASTGTGEAFRWTDTGGAGMGRPALSSLALSAG